MRRSHQRQEPDIAQSTDILADELGYRSAWWPCATLCPMVIWPPKLSMLWLQRRYGSAQCTIEEREYEPTSISRAVIFAGVDYEAIFAPGRARSRHHHFWDGGNNDLPFYRPGFPSLWSIRTRARSRVALSSGEANLRMADAMVINKIDTADAQGVNTVLNNVRAVNLSHYRFAPHRRCLSKT